jgi:hypothetical protein
LNNLFVTIRRHPFGIPSFLFKWNLHCNNNIAEIAVDVKLKKGKNVIRLENPHAKAPDIDCFILVEK